MPRKKQQLNFENGIGVVYARFSCHKQKDTSIEQQVAACRKKAESLGITIVDTYEDRSMTGKTDKRLNLQRLLRDADNRKFQYLFAWKSDRIGRNMEEQLANQSRLMSCGIQILYVEESFDDTAAGRYAARNMMNINQFYSESMAENIKRAMYDNAENCKVANGNLPFGYKANKNLKYIIDKPRAEIVREIFTKVAEGVSFVDIAESLNLRGITTRKGGKWGKSSFQTIIHNERYRGIYIYNDVRIEGGIPRIVSDELFFKVQEVLKTKKNAQGRHRVYGEYLLTGKLYCGECQAPMVGCSGTGKSGTLHHYYVCQNRRLNHTCNKENVRRDNIEVAVAKAIQKMALTDEAIEWIADNTIAYFKKQEESSDLSILKDRLDGVNKSIKNLLTAIEQGIITDTTKNRLFELEEEKADLEIKITLAKAESIPQSKEDLLTTLSMYQEGDVYDAKYRASLFNTFLVAVYLFDDHFKLVFNPTGKPKTLNIPFEEISTPAQNGEPSGSYKVCFGSPGREPRHAIRVVEVLLFYIKIHATIPI